jgi:hypothetical protein
MKFPFLEKRDIVGRKVVLESKSKNIKGSGDIVGI